MHFDSPFAPGDLIQLDSPGNWPVFLFIRSAKDHGIVAARIVTSPDQCTESDMVFLPVNGWRRFLGSAFWAKEAVRLAAAITDDELLIKKLLE